MENPKKVFYRNQAESIIARLKQRKMDAYYCADVEEAKKKVVELLGEGRKSVAYGGSMTIDENGFKDAITAAGHELVVRENATTPEELKKVKADTVNADAFIMSTNAITLDGELINIDGRGNRVSFLIYGPESVIIVAGMNKVVSDVQSGIARARNMAAAPNTVRLSRKTPCAQTGVCGDCLNYSICSQIVITRTSIIKDRIKVILVGEELGY